MPEYLAPGVYVEETSFRAKSIEGVGTSTTAFVGPCRKGPVVPGTRVDDVSGKMMEQAPRPVDVPVKRPVGESYTAGWSGVGEGRPYVVVYDGHCKVCGRLVALLRKWDTRGMLEIVPFQNTTVLDRFPWIPASAYAEALQLVGPGGGVGGQEGLGDGAADPASRPGNQGDPGAFRRHRRPPFAGSLLRRGAGSGAPLLLSSAFETRVTSRSGRTLHQLGLARVGHVPGAQH